MTGSHTTNQHVVVLPIEDEGEAMAAVGEEVITVEWQEEAHSGYRVDMIVIFDNTAKWFQNIRPFEKNKLD